MRGHAGGDRLFGSGRAADNSRLFLLAGVLVLAAMLILRGSYLPLVLSPGLKWAKLFYFLSIVMGVALIVSSLSILFLQRASPARHPWLARASLGCCRWSCSCTSFFRASTSSDRFLLREPILMRARPI